MRWERLFADLEAQLAAEADADLRVEVADRVRAELAQVPLVDRLRAHVGAGVVLHLAGGAAPLVGVLADVGADWCVLAEEGPADRSALVPLGALVGVGGLSRRVATPAGEVLRRTTVGAALRVLARDRTPVRVLLPGAELVGTLDRVGADHVDVALHAWGEARRPGAVREVRTVPLAALLAVRSA